MDKIIMEDNLEPEQDIIVLALFFISLQPYPYRAVVGAFDFV